MDMGYADYGGGAGRPAGTSTPAGVSVATLTGPSGAPAVLRDADRAQGVVHAGPGERVDGYTLNGTSPGPEIRATAGDLVQVDLVNESVPDGVTLHWHGVDVPNAEDGVAGVTQDAVPVGGRHVYRFVAERGRHVLVPLAPGVPRAGDRRAVRRAGRRPGRAAVERDVVAAGAHLRRPADGERARRATCRSTAPAGRAARVRVINTDNGPMPVWVTGAPYRVVAVDGTDVHGPTEVTDRRSLARRRRPGRPRGHGAGRRRRGPGRAGRRAALVSGRPARRPGARPRRRDARPAVLRHAGAARLRPGATSTAHFDYASAGGPASSTGGPGCGGRSTASSSRTCRCSWSREGDVVRDARSATTRARCTRCTCTATTRVVLARDGVRGHRQPVVDRLARRRRRRDLRRSRSGPTTPASGWTTATTCRTPPTGWSRT